MENIQRGESMLKTEAEMMMLQSDKIRIDRELQKILRELLENPKK